MRVRPHLPVLAGLALLATGALSLGAGSQGAWADTAPGTGEAETVSAEPLPTWQTNGEVWAVEEIDGVVYAGGRFTSVRPPGARPGNGEVPRRNLAAFDTATGELLPWAPKPAAVEFEPGPGEEPDSNCSPAATPGYYTCDTVWEIRASPDRKKVYVGGDFDTVDGKGREGLAAFDRAAGTLDATFKPPAVWGRVRALATTASAVYAGGNFTKVAPGTSRSRLAGFDQGSGALLPWNPTVDATVLAMAAAPDASRVVVGGTFDRVNGKALRGLAAVDTEAGASVRWDSRPITKKSSDEYSRVTDLAVRGDTVYVGAEGFHSWEGRLAADLNTGQLRWQDVCWGATWAVEPVGDVVYGGSHAHDCSAHPGGFPESGWLNYPNTDYLGRYHRLTAEQVRDGQVRILHWFPSTNGGTGGKLGPRDLTSDGRYLWVAGEFTTVNDRPQQGLTRFATRAAHAVSNPPTAPSQVVASSVRAGRVTVAFNGATDLDNETLTYQVVRDGNTANPVWTGSAAGKPWKLPSLSVTDDKVTAGATHTYQVRAVDPHGTAGPLSPPARVTVAAEDLPYPRAVVAEGAATYWRFNEDSASTAQDRSGHGSDGSYDRGIFTTGQSGVLRGDASVRKDSRSLVVSRQNQVDPANFTVEIWVKPTGRSGKILGFSSSRAGGSRRHDRALYLDSSGRLVFGMREGVGHTTSDGEIEQDINRAGPVYTIATDRTYRDGEWHHVAASYQAGQLRLSVDGVQVAERQLRHTWPFTGYWQVGGGDVPESPWPNEPSAGMAGYLDEFAHYPVPLTQEQIAHHHELGRKG